VLLPVRDAPILARGDRIVATGKLASRSGALQVSVGSATGVRIVGVETLPVPRLVASSGLGEAVEGLLVRATGSVTRLTRATSGSTTLAVSDTTGSLTVSCWQPCAADAARGARVEVTGIAGQLWSRSGAADGYRIWPRDESDVRVLESTDGGGATPSPGSSPTPPPGVVTISSAKSKAGVVLTVEAVVTTAPGFIDPDPRRVVVQDASGGILVRLPSDAARVALGDRLRLTGRVGTLGGAPQLAATAATVLGHGTPTSASALTVAPTKADEWRLVRADGRVQTVRRYGSTWRAEVRLAGGAIVPIQGISRSGIPSTALVEGRDATVSGIVRRPSSGAADQRLAVVPRSPADIALGPAAAAASSAGSVAAGTGGVTSVRGAQPATAGQAGLSGGTGAIAGIDVDLADIGAHLGELVRVGGSVAATRVDGVTLDDGTGQADARFVGEAGALLDSIEPGDVLNVTGTVVRTGDAAPAVVVSDPAGISRVGRLGESIPIAAASSPGTPGTALGPGEDGADAGLREVRELRLGPVAMAMPTGLSGWVLGSILGLLLAGSVAAVLAGRRLGANRREQVGKGLVDRLGRLLATPTTEAHH